MPCSSYAKKIALSCRLRLSRVWLAFSQVLANQPLHSPLRQAVDHEQEHLLSREQ